MSADETETKREDYLTWDNYFMAIAFLSAQRSKDQRTQVGACIVNEHKRICGAGYNGMPDRCNDDEMAWGRGEDLQNKHLYVCHAEMNAIVNKNAADVRGCTIYTGLFPCNECAKIIIQSGLKEVVYYSDKKEEEVAFKAARKMFATAGVALRQYRPKVPITIDFTKMDDKKVPPSTMGMTMCEGNTQMNPDIHVAGIGKDIFDNGQFSCSGHPIDAVRNLRSKNPITTDFTKMEFKNVPASTTGWMTSGANKQKTPDTHVAWIGKNIFDNGPFSCF